ncbi:MAG TPA: hypothetical protein PKD00_09340 [Burkholderiales bacterium]|nr:hypothetical protein [Burkholderiales bacterium]
MNNFKDIKTHLNSHTTSVNLSWEENKQKASIKILNYINGLVNEFKIDSKDTFDQKIIKSKNIQQTQKTLLYVLDKLQKSLNQGFSPNFEEFDNIANNDKLDKQLYLNLTGQSSISENIDTNHMSIKPLREKESKTLLKNLKIIITHKNTDGFWNNSNTKTSWFGKDKYNSRTKTHQDFVNFINNGCVGYGKFFTNLSQLKNQKNTLKYIGGVGHHSAKLIEKLFGLDEDYKYIKGFGVLDLGHKYNFAQIKGKFDKGGVPISGQIKCHNDNSSLIKNSVEFYKNPKDGKYYFKRTIIQKDSNLKIYLFKTNNFYSNTFKNIIGTTDKLENIEKETPVFIGKKTVNGYSGNLQLGEKCLTGDFDNNFQITKLKEFGLINNQSDIQLIHIGNDSRQKEIVKDYDLNKPYWFSQSTLFSSKDFEYLFNKLNNIKQSFNNEYIKQKVSDGCISEYTGETNNENPHGFGIINWSDTKHTFIGEFKDGKPLCGLIIKDNKVFHIEYNYNDINEKKTVEKNIDEYSLNIFMESIYEKYNYFIIDNYNNLKLESLLNLITQNTGFKIKVSHKNSVEKNKEILLLMQFKNVEDLMIEYNRNPNPLDYLTESEIKEVLKDPQNYQLPVLTSLIPDGIYDADKIFDSWYCLYILKPSFKKIIDDIIPKFSHAIKLNKKHSIVYENINEDKIIAYNFIDSKLESFINVIKLFNKIPNLNNIDSLTKMIYTLHYTSKSGIVNLLGNGNKELGKKEYNDLKNKVLFAMGEDLGDSRYMIKVFTNFDDEPSLKHYYYKSEGSADKVYKKLYHPSEVQFILKNNILYDNFEEAYKSLFHEEESILKLSSELSGENVKKLYILEHRHDAEEIIERLKNNICKSLREKFKNDA